MGAVVATLVAELLAATETVLEPIRARHAAEREALDERVKMTGERGAGRRDLEERPAAGGAAAADRRAAVGPHHLWPVSTATGLSAALIVRSRPGRPLPRSRRCASPTKRLVRNPNEPLQLQALLLRLSGAGERLP